MPSSLTTLLSSTFGFSPYPPVSVFGTGTNKSIVAFLGGSSLCFPTSFSVLLCLPFIEGTSLFYRYCTSTGFPFPGSHFVSASPHLLFLCGAGISTCSPSTTLLSLALGPDSPRADQLYSGTLGYSVGRILTSLSLLIPAFSLLKCPLPLSGSLLPFKIAPLPMISHSTASVLRFSPGHFRRKTSRLVSYYALFERVAASKPTS